MHNQRESLQRKLQESQKSMISLQTKCQEMELKLKELAFVQVVFPSNSNFLLIRVDDANKRYKQLIDYGIVVRNRSNVRGCENCLRVTVGTPQQNKILINTLKKI